MKTQILELEKKYWQGMENHDYETVKNLTHFPCIVAGKNGVESVDEATFKKMFDSGANANIKVKDFTGIQTQTIGEDAAIIAYRIALVSENGKPDMECACTSTWIKEDDQWTCALHTESELVN